MIATEVSLCGMTWGQKKEAMGRLPGRQMVALGCDIARTVLPIWEEHDAKDKRPLKAIQASESWTVHPDAAYAAASTAAADAARAAYAATYATYTATYAAYAAYTAAYAAYAAAAADAAAAANAAYAAAYDTSNPEKIKARIDGLYLQAVRRKAIPNNRDILNLASIIWRERKIELGPILADALEEEGFGCVQSLYDLRSMGYGGSHWVIYSLNVKEK